MRYFSYAPENVKRTLAKIIEDELPKVKLNKTQLAKLVGLSGSHFTNVSNGKASSRKSGYRPDPEVVNNLAHYLNVPVEEILEGLGYQLSVFPPELSRFIENYKILPEPNKKIVLNIVNSLFELINQNEKLENETGTAIVNGQEVTIRILEPIENLPKIFTKGKR